MKRHQTIIDSHPLQELIDSFHSVHEVKINHFYLCLSQVGTKLWEKYFNYVRLIFWDGK